MCRRSGVCCICCIELRSTSLASMTEVNRTTGEAIAEEKRAKEEKVASGEEPPELV